MPKKAKARSPRKAPVVATAAPSGSIGGRPSKGNVELVGLKIAPGYLRLLDLEAHRLCMGRREFLMMLHLRRTGEQPIERPASAPRYELRPEELAAEGKLYKWALTPEQRISVDQERRKVGNPTTSWYLILLLCSWLGIDPILQGQSPEPIGGHTKGGEGGD